MYISKEIQKNPNEIIKNSYKEPKKIPRKNQEKEERKAVLDQKSLVHTDSETLSATEEQPEQQEQDNTFPF